MRVSRPLGAALTRLALVALVVASCQTTGTSLQSPAAGYRPDDSSVPPSPYAQVRWKAVLLAGDNSIKAFDNAIDDLAVLLQLRGVEVVQRFSADGTRASEKVALATEVNLRRVTSTWKVAPGEGCLLYATSHGTIHGIWLARDSDGGRILKPTSLKTMLAAACGDAPTVVVMSGCHTGTFLHKDTVGPNTIMLTAADTYQKSFGCRAGRRYTYYDACFLQEFPRATTWQDLYRRVSGCVDVEERSLREQSSSPQAFFGRQMKDLPLPGKN